MGSCCPFQKMNELPKTKPEPFTVRLNVSPPALTEVGVSEVITGAGFKIVKGNDWGVPPPGSGVKTCTVAADWENGPESSEVSRVVKMEPLTKVVEWSRPLN